MWTADRHEGSCKYLHTMRHSFFKSNTYFWAETAQPATTMVHHACPHVEMAHVHDATHSQTLDQPEQTVAIVVDFLQRHRLIT